MIVYTVENIAGRIDEDWLRDLFLMVGPCTKAQIFWGNVDGEWLHLGIGTVTFSEDLSDSWLPLQFDGVVVFGSPLRVVRDDSGVLLRESLSKLGMVLPPDGECEGSSEDRENAKPKQHQQQGKNQRHPRRITMK